MSFTAWLAPGINGSNVVVAVAGEFHCHQLGGDPLYQWFGRDIYIPIEPKLPMGALITGHAASISLSGVLNDGDARWAGWRVRPLALAAPDGDEQRCRLVARVEARDTDGVLEWLAYSVTFTLRIEDTAEASKFVASLSSADSSTVT